MTLTIRGNDFCKFFGANKVRLELVDRKLTQKSTRLTKLTSVYNWPFLGVEKVVFWTFSKFFWTCLGSVWVLLLALIALLWVYIQLQKEINNPKNRNCWSNILLILAVLRGHFRPFWGSKKSFSGLFQSCFGVV